MKGSKILAMVSSFIPKIFPFEDLDGTFFRLNLTKTFESIVYGFSTSFVRSRADVTA